MNKLMIAIVWLIVVLGILFGGTIAVKQIAKQAEQAIQKSACEKTIDGETINVCQPNS